PGPRWEAAGLRSTRCGPPWPWSGRAGEAGDPPAGVPRRPGARSPRAPGEDRRRAAPAHLPPGGRHERPRPFRRAYGASRDRRRLPAAGRRGGSLGIGRGRSLGGFTLLRPWHHGPELGTHPFDLVVVVGLAEALEVAAAG